MTDQRDVEVRVGYYGGMLMTSEEIQAIRFNLQVEEHYRKEREDHELLMHALSLKATPSYASNMLLFTVVLLSVAWWIFAVIVWARHR